MKIKLALILTVAASLLGLFESPFLAIYLISVAFLMSELLDSCTPRPRRRH